MAYVREHAESNPAVMVKKHHKTSHNNFGRYPKTWKPSLPWETLRVRLGFTQHTWPTRISRLWNLRDVKRDVTMMSMMSMMSPKSWRCPLGYVLIFTRSVHNPGGRCLGRMPLKKNFSSASHVDFITMVWCGSTGPRIHRIPQVSTGETRLAWEIQGGFSVTWYWIVKGHSSIFLAPRMAARKGDPIFLNSRDAKNTCVALCCYAVHTTARKKPLADLLGNFLLCGASCHTFDWWLWALIILKCFDWGSDGICSIVDEIHGIYSSGFSGDWSFSKTWLLHTTSLSKNNHKRWWEEIELMEL